MAEEKKPYLSPAQLDMLCRCGEQYRRRYLEHDVVPPGIAALKGTGVHAGAKANFRQKLETGVDLPANDIVEASVEAFRSQLAGGYTLTTEEASAPAATINEAVEDLMAMAEVHALDQAPDYQPVLVEQTVRVAVPSSPRDLLGVIDLADDLERVVDFKTGKRLKSQSDCDESVQLTMYAVAYAALRGHPPESVRLDTVVSSKTRCYRHVLDSRRDARDTATFAARLTAANKAIDGGIFLPAVPGCWWCAPKWCGYWSSCRYVNAERAAAASDNDV